MKVNEMTVRLILQLKKQFDEDVKNNKLYFEVVLSLCGKTAVVTLKFFSLRDKGILNFPHVNILFFIM